MWRVLADLLAQARIAWGATGKDEVFCPGFVMLGLPSQEALDGPCSKGADKNQSEAKKFCPWRPKIFLSQSQIRLPAEGTETIEVLNSELFEFKKN